MTLFELFFTTHIPDALRYRSFTAPHLALLAAVCAGILTAAYVCGRLRASGRRRILLCFTWALPCVYALRFTMFALLDYYVEPQMGLLDRLPFHLCAMNAIVMPLAVVRKNKLLLNYMYAIAMPAAVAAMLTPAMSYYGNYFYFSWQLVFFFLDHGLMVLVPILAIRTGLFRPDVRTLPRVLGLFGAYAACMYLLNKLLDQNFLFLNYPDEGTVMAYFARYLGNPGYLLPLAALAAVVICLMYVPWLIAAAKHNRNA